MKSILLRVEYVVEEIEGACSEAKERRGKTDAPCFLPDKQVLGEDQGREYEPILDPLCRAQRFDEYTH